MKGNVLHGMNGDRILQVAISSMDTMRLGEQVLRLAAEKIADEWVKQHGAEVMALIRPEAIASMTMAEAADTVNETLHKKLPDKVLEVVRTEREVWQRGVFGGLRRIW